MYRLPCAIGHGVIGPLDQRRNHAPAKYSTDGSSLPCCLALLPTEKFSQRPTTLPYDTSSCLYLKLTSYTQYAIGWAYGHVAYAPVNFAGSVINSHLNDMGAHTP